MAKSTGVGRSGHLSPGVFAAGYREDVAAGTCPTGIYISQAAGASEAAGGSALGRAAQSRGWPWPGPAASNAWRLKLDGPPAGRDIAGP